MNYVQAMMRDERKAKQLAERKEIKKISKKTDSLIKQANKLLGKSS